MPSNKFKTRFPPARIKKIMQTDEEVGKVAAAVPVVVSKSLELFTEVFLAKCGEIAAGRGARTLSIDHIKQCVDNEQKFDFLREIVAEAAAKAVGKTPEEATAVAALSMGKLASSTSSTVPKSVNYAARRKNHRVGAPNFVEDEQLKPEPFSPGFPGPSGSVIAHRSPVAEKLRLPSGKRQQVKEESDLDSEDEDLLSRSVYTTPDKPVFPHAQPREFFSKSPSASPHVLKEHSSTKRPKKETGRSSGTPTSVIVRSPPAVVCRSNGSSPGLYANTTKAEPLRLLSPMVTLPSPFYFGTSPMYSPSLAAFPHSPVDPFAASYQQQLMMAMMMQQQQQLQQAQLPVFAQHERNQERESTVSRPTYGSPMDYPSAQASPQHRSVIVPTSSAQDLRLNRPVDLTAPQQNGSGYCGQRYAMYQEKDDPI